jgi:hypothetical protein
MGGEREAVPTIQPIQLGVKAILRSPKQEAGMQWMVGVHEDPMTCIPHPSFSSIGGLLKHQMILSSKAVESDGFPLRPIP